MSTVVDPVSVHLLSNLILWVVVLDDIDRLSDLKAQLIGIFLVVPVGGLHSVQHTRGQFRLRGDTWNGIRAKG